MSELLPAAQAVLDAANDVCIYRPDRDDMRLAVAAALRAAADHVVPEIVHPDAEEWLEHPTWIQVELRVRRQLFAIADKLESQ
jgi:hypothetical protein